jgi:hypothetical protein
MAIPFSGDSIAGDLGDRTFRIIEDNPNSKVFLIVILESQ